MCLSRVLTPQRLPHPGSVGFRGGLHVESGGDVSRERSALPVDTPSPHLDSALKLLEHVGGTQLLTTSISRQLLKVINRTIEQRGREGHRVVVSTGNRGFPGHRQAQGSCLPNLGLRSSGRGGKARTEGGRTPCLSHRLPD
jgi:hypothetical protein